MYKLVQSHSQYASACRPAHPHKRLGMIWSCTLPSIGLRKFGLTGKCVFVPCASGHRWVLLRVAPRHGKQNRRSIIARFWRGQNPILSIQFRLCPDDGQEQEGVIPVLYSISRTAYLRLQNVWLLEHSEMIWGTSQLPAFV